MGDFAVGASHGRRYGPPHGGPWLNGRQGWGSLLRLCGPFDVGAGDGAALPGTLHRVEIDSQFGGQFARQRRDPETFARYGGRAFLAVRGDHADLVLEGGFRRPLFAGRFCLLPCGADRCQHRADGNLLAWVDQDLLDRAVGKDLDLDDALLGFNLGDDIAALDLVAGLDLPFDQEALFHVGTQTGHAELSHWTAPFVLRL